MSDTPFKHSYHVITPFSRWENLLKLSRHLQEFGITWHPIVNNNVPFELVGSWIDSIHCDPIPEGYFAGHWKQNWFTDHATIEDEDRYCLLNDDDHYSLKFFDTIDAVEGDVLIASMERGSTLHECIASSENLKQNEVGGEQIIVCGRILRSFRWGSEYTGDWTFINNVTEKHPPVFVPEAKILWNYLDSRFWPDHK